MVATCLVLELLAVHQEKLVALLVAKGVHQELPIVVEASRVFIERSEKSPDFLLFRSG